MHVLKKCNENETIVKHRKILTKMIITSLAKGNFTLQKLNNTQTPKLDNNSSDEYTRRHKQRIIYEYYKESIFESSEQVDDKRIKQFSSVFSHDTLPQAR